MERGVGTGGRNNNMRKSLIISIILVSWGCSTNGPQASSSQNHVKSVNESPRNSRAANQPVPTRNADSDAERQIQAQDGFCENYILGRINKEGSQAGRARKLDDSRIDEGTKSPELSKWLSKADPHLLSAYELTYNGARALLLHSKSVGATGLASSLEYWFLEVDSKYSVSFTSFSKNPNLVFWDHDGVLNYYSVLYSDDFVENKDWDNLTFNIQHYKVSPDVGTELVETERNVKCA